MKKQILLNGFFLILLTHSLSAFALSLKMGIPLGHSKEIIDAVLSEDGQMIYSLSDDNSLRTWQVASGREINKQSWSANLIQQVALSNNQTQLAIGNKNDQVMIKTIKNNRTLSLLPPQKNIIEKMAFDKAGKNLVLVEKLSSKKIRIKVWNIQQQRFNYEFISRKKGKIGDLFLIKNQLKIVFRKSKSIYIYTFDLNNPASPIKQKIKYKQKIKLTKLSPNGLKIQTVFKTQLIETDLKSLQQRIFKLDQITQGKPLDIGYYQQHLVILNRENEHQMRLIDVTNQSTLMQFKGRIARPTQLTLSADGKFLIAGYNADSILIWDLKTAQVSQDLWAKVGKINSLIMDKAMNFMVSTSTDTQLRLWALNDPVKSQKRTFAKKQRIRAALCDKKALLVSDASRVLSQFYVTYRGRGNPILRKKKTLNNQQPVHLFACNPQRIITSSKKGTTQVWQSKGAKFKIQDFQLEKVLFRNEKLQALDMDKTGKYAVSAGNQLRLWDLDSGRKICTLSQPQTPKYLTAHLYQFNQTHYLVAGGRNQVAKLWKIKNNRCQLLQTFKGHDGAVEAVVLSQNKVITAGQDGTIRLWNKKTGQEILKLLASQYGEWVAVTPDGFYERSVEGSKLIYWIAKQAQQSYAFQQFEKKFRQPLKIKQRLATLSGAFNQINVRRPPSLILNQHLLTQQSKQPYYQLNIRAESDSGLKSIQVFVNGIKQIEKRQSGRRVNEKITVPLLAGTNTITLTAYDRYDLSSDPRYVSVDFKASKKQTKPTLYLLSIGLNHYPNFTDPASVKLNSATSDAQRFEKLFKNYSHCIFDKVESTLITEQEVTVKNIQKQLNLLVHKVKKQDVLLVFLAGHGFNVENKFYYLTSQSSEKTIATTSLVWDTFSQFFDQIKGRSLLFIDACHSGSITSDNLVANDLLAAKLYSKHKGGGTLVFSAAKGRQFAGENKKGGYFSNMIYQAIAQKSKLVDRNKNNTIELKELVDYVEQAVYKTSLYEPQTPWLSNRGIMGDFPIACRKE